MKSRSLIALGVLVLLLLIAQNVSAMSSTNYRLDWLTPATTNGGGRVNSTNYVAYFSIGQTGIGPIESTSYSGGLGYWYGLTGWFHNYLPFIRRDAP